MVHDRRHTERTRSSVSSKRSIKHFIHVDGLRMSQYLGWKTHYNPRYPQLRPSLTSPPPDLIRPVDTRPPEFNISDLECLRVLGEGATGKVLLVRSVRTIHRLDRPGSLYALKVFTKEFARRTDKAESTSKDVERSILAKLPWNSFISGILQVFSDEMNLYTMMEFIPRGSLRGLLQNRGPFDATSSTFYFSNIAAGLEFLEVHNVFHRDLKPENILVGADGYLVLADFGEGAHEYDYENTKWIQVGSPVYSAPEMMSMDEEDMTLSGVDWWSAGIILYEMTYRKLPWWGRDQLDIHRKKAAGILKWRPGIKVGQGLKSLISGLLTVNTTKRLGAKGAQEVMNHEWLKEIKWSKIKGHVYIAPYVPPNPLNVEETWHKLPLPSNRKMPGLANIVEPPSHLIYNDCFPVSNIEDDELDSTFPTQRHKDDSRDQSNWPFQAF